MGKVMISLPDDVLERLDAYARQRGTSRSGLLRVLAEREFAAVDQDRQVALHDLLAKPGHYGGTAAHEVRRLRDTR